MRGAALGGAGCTGDGRAVDARSSARAARHGRSGAQGPSWAEERSPSSATRPLPPACSARACALRSPQPLMSCGARGFAGLRGRAPSSPHPRQPARESHLPLRLREVTPLVRLALPRSFCLPTTHLEKKKRHDAGSGGHLLLVLDT